MVIALLLAACAPNPCIEMCQEYKRWIEACGSTWEEAFPDQGWDSLEACYDDHWEAPPGKQNVCRKETRAYAELACTE